MGIFNYKSNVIDSISSHTQKGNDKNESQP